ncbi:MAG: hypothetical protein A2Y73_05555 [Chloroflexi bacterium RBG_13_56_8]|nr:MAG: hypothetical protein A2Y73_05555 [Chloroflexi bacterium RBG_13_56_8]
MLSLLRHLLAADYLYAQQTTPLNNWSLFHTLWSVGLLLGALLAWKWGKRLTASGQPNLVAYISALSFAISLALFAIHVQVTGPLSARIWHLSAAMVALLTPLAHWIAHRPWPEPVQTLGRSLACRLTPDDLPLPWFWQVGWGALHVAGLYTLSVYAGLGWWGAVLAIVCIGLATWGTQKQKALWRAPRTEVLTPLLIPYASVVLRWLLSQVLGVDIEPYQAFPYADIWAPWFDLRTTWLAGLAWITLTTGALLIRSKSRPRITGMIWLGLTAFVMSIGWYIVTAATHLSHGANGSDPYCYLQMAVDLVERGTALHNFPLASLAREVDLPLWPVVHTGYHPPAAGTLAPTVWPIGWPLIMAPFYALGGEKALTWTAPLFSIVAAVVTWLTARELWPQAPRNKQWLAGGVAAFILLTSQEAVLRSLVPMADACAQALSIGSFLCLVRGQRRDSLIWSATAGALFSLAYFVRHPQLPLALMVLPVLVWGKGSWSRRLTHIGIFAGAALICAVPDGLYRVTTFGSLWASESPEWHLLSWRNIGTTFVAMLREGGISRREFGYLLPLTAYGAWRQWRERSERLWATTMWVGFLAVLGFNLSYSAVRLRDLISLFPWLGLWAGWGVAQLWEWATIANGRRAARRTLVLGVVLMSLCSRTVLTLTMPWQEKVWVFGYVSAEEREGYTQLARALPDGAVVATGLGSGAIELYTGHNTVRPYWWSHDEFARFVEHLATQGRPLYILDDGEEMGLFVERTGENYQILPVEELTLPTFGLGGQDYGRPAMLYSLGE